MTMEMMENGKEKIGFVAEYEGQALKLAMQLFREADLIPKTTGKDEHSIYWSVNSSPLATSENLFERLIHIRPLYVMRSNFHYNKGLVKSAFGPYLAIGIHYGHQSLNIEGDIRCHYRGYRRKYFNETDIRFLGYKYADGLMNWDGLLDAAERTFKPEIIREFVDWDKSSMNKIYEPVYMPD